MSFRSDHDAAVARAKALEAELEAERAKGELVRAELRAERAERERLEAWHEQRAKMPKPWSEAYDWRRAWQVLSLVFIASFVLLFVLLYLPTVLFDFRW